LEENEASNLVVLPHTGWILLFALQGRLCGSSRRCKSGVPAIRRLL